MLCTWNISVMGNMLGSKGARKTLKKETRATPGEIMYKQP